MSGSDRLRIPGRDPGPSHTREALWNRRIRLEEVFRQEREAGLGDFGDRLSRSRIPEWMLRSVGLWKRGIRNAQMPILAEYTLSVSGLPEFLRGYRILFLADFHFDERFPKFAHAVQELVSGVEADICLLGGDYRFAHEGEYSHVFRDMAVVLERIAARDGIHAVLGNHDLSTFAEPLGELGVQMLINENRRIESRGGSFWLAGVDDQHRYHCESLPLATEGISADAFTVLLAHSPELAVTAPDFGVNLYLCGHTHWGQVRLPIVGALTYNAHCPLPFCRGVWKCKTMTGYTTAGIGTTDLPIRFNCPPEACLLTLSGA